MIEWFEQLQIQVGCSDVAVTVINTKSFTTSEDVWAGEF